MFFASAKRALKTWILQMFCKGVATFGEGWPCCLCECVLKGDFFVDSPARWALVFMSILGYIVPGFANVGSYFLWLFVLNLSGV